jgi:hypothetical protein
VPTKLARKSRTPVLSEAKDGVVGVRVFADAHVLLCCALSIGLTAYWAFYKLGDEFTAVVVIVAAATVVLAEVHPSSQ